METQTPIVSVANATFRLPNSASARIIAAGIVIAFLHFASSVVVTLLVAVLLAYFLDPIVTWLERLAHSARAGRVPDRHGGHRRNVCDWLGPGQ